MFPFRRIFGRCCHAIVTPLLECLSEREDIVPPVAGDVARPSALPQENQDVLKKLREMKLGAHIDHALSISIGRLGEKYYLMIVIDGIDFLWPQTCQTRTHPEDHLHEFLTMSRLKISTIRFDGASEFGKSSSFIAYCTLHDIVREPLASYTPRRFWPDALRHFCRLYACWPDANGLSAWEKLDSLQPHQMRHNLVKDLHVFGSYVTGHLPREHPHVAPNIGIISCPSCSLGMFPVRSL